MSPPRREKLIFLVMRAYGGGRTEGEQANHIFPVKMLWKRDIPHSKREENRRNCRRNIRDDGRGETRRIQQAREKLRRKRLDPTCAKTRGGSTKEVDKSMKEIAEFEEKL